MNNKKLVSLFTCPAIVLAMSTSAIAGPWAVPNGDPAGGNFSYQNGGDIDGLYGEPSFIGNKVSFFAATFSTFDLTSDGNSVIVDDTVTFEMLVDPGYTLSHVTVTAFGEYGVSGVGSTVSASGSWTVEELGGMNRFFTDPLVTVPGFPYTFGQGNNNSTWSGVGTTDISFQIPSAHSHLEISLTAAVEALAASGGSATINMNFQDIEFEFFFVPEPGTLALFGLAGAVLAIRRRR